MSIRNYSAVAVQTTLSEPLNSTAVIARVGDVTGWPAPPFTLIIDKDQAAEEVVEVTDVSLNVITIVRGVDGSPPLPHEAGAPVVHGVSARDFREPNIHGNSPSGVHGVTGALVGTSDPQTLDRKTFLSSDGTGPALTIRQAPGQAGNMVEVRTSTGVLVGYIDAGATLVVPQVRTTTKASFTPATAAGTAVEVRAKAGQTADLVRVLDTADEVLFSVGPGGNVFAPNLTQDTLNATDVVAQTVSTGTLAVTGNTSLANVGVTSLSSTGAVTTSGLNVTGSANVGSLSTGSLTSGAAGVAELTAASGTFSGSLTHQGTIPVPRMAAGTASLSLTSDFSGVVAITFPSGRFTVPPIVQVCLRNAVAGSGSLSARAINVTSNGCDIYVYTGNNAVTTATGVSVQWTAVQMTSGSAAG